MVKNRRDRFVAGSFAAGSSVYTCFMLGLMVRAGISRFLLFFYAVLGIALAATIFGVVGRELEDQWLDEGDYGSRTSESKQTSMKKVWKQVGKLCMGKKRRKKPAKKSVDNRQELLRRYQETGMELLGSDAAHRWLMEETKLPTKKEEPPQPEPIRQKRVPQKPVMGQQESTGQRQEPIRRRKTDEKQNQRVVKPELKEKVENQNVVKIDSSQKAADMQVVKDISEKEARYERAKALAKMEIQRLLQKKMEPAPPHEEQPQYGPMYEKAETLRKRGALVMAASLYEECLKQGEGGPQCRDRLIKCLLDMGELTKASRVLEESTPRNNPEKGQK